ncbi:hypothetical protein BZB76_2822 [Actinomadura pelletieri DSM 43383]|uniref:CATRA-Associated Small Protein domain-containing protein n=1 Tax=Actinomadura pelletieri DSM 43383 TaxID=1120940 RepID=A0A495QMZ0_9ACTN|nr:CATRA system-associated protein [Actinomadura pelletieri]RKS74311.1 hypothetical protein BZB76_2822 [Actinomadura pelletieri DSM 43383]
MEIADDQEWDEVLLEARTIVQEMLDWRLAPARWDSTVQILDVLAEAAETKDLATVRQAVVDLELHGPIRITRIGATPVVPAPPPVRERVNHLVHRLSGGDAQNRGRS